MKKKKRLKRMDFDSHIWISFLAFLGEEELRDGLEFSCHDAVNRNPEQVCDELWKDLLKRHLKMFNDN